LASADHPGDRAGGLGHPGGLCALGIHLIALCSRKATEMWIHYLLKIVVLPMLSAHDTPLTPPDASRPARTATVSRYCSCAHRDSSPWPATPPTASTAAPRHQPIRCHVKRMNRPVGNNIPNADPAASVRGSNIKRQPHRPTPDCSHLHANSDTQRGCSVRGSSTCAFLHVRADRALGLEARRA
jgi:hypothetical protein